MARKSLKNLAVDQGAGEEAPTSTDALIAQKSNGDPKWFAVSALESALDHDALTNFEADEHAAPKKSIEVDAGELQLVGDEASPGNDKVYGTDGSGNKGWKDDPAGGGASAIDDLSDVTISGTPADNEVVAYDTTSGEFINQTAAEAGLAEASHNHAAGDVTSGTFDDARIAASNVTQHEGTIDHDALVNFETDEHAAPKNSIEVDVGELQLVGDEASPGNDKVYGTDGSGSKGWKNDPAGGAGSLTRTDDASTTLTLTDTHDGTLRVLTADTAITITLDAQASVGTRTGLEVGGDGAITVQVESGATYLTRRDPEDATGATANFGVPVYVVFEVTANSDGNSAVWTIVEDGTDLEKTVDAPVNFNGKLLYGARVGVESVSGVLNNTHLGKRLLTTGAITIPTSPTGWWATIEIGADTHDLTFNATTLDISVEGWSAGDIIGVTVLSSTTLDITRTSVANKYTESNFS